MATILQTIEADGLLRRTLLVPVNVVNGAAAGTFTLPAGAIVQGVQRDTPVTIPGSPTNTNLRLGSAANGQQYVADVDLKAQGFSALTVVYAMRNAAQTAAATVHFTVASSGGTAADQDGVITLHIEYVLVA
jgi:hypothetical protein